ncbi:signal recognition particle-docking protein FtsY [Candidatus Sumerlaeota bacterium]|nr:signal recognition particle-docking protein FtsY [Candidatus Sumerlaeota bacterium]
MAEEKNGLLSKLSQKLFKPKTVVREVRRLAGLKSKVDADFLDEMEDILIHGDVGVETTQKIIEFIRKDPRTHKETDPHIIVDLMYDAMFEIFQQDERKLAFGPQKPYVVLVVGVNGTGKTTTIGKMALELTNQGKEVLLIAADTFRAAAVEQLGIWANRTGCGLVMRPEGSDPASVCYDGLTCADAKYADVILIDTAGRLHTKIDLMEELKKIDRVIKKVMPGAPHETLLVLDATTGQNAINQAKIFNEAVNVTGIVMTKYDGTAKGGIIVAVRDIFKIPILKVGVGEGAEDLRDFEPQEFVDALFAE